MKGPKREFTKDEVEEYEQDARRLEQRLVVFEHLIRDDVTELNELADEYMQRFNDYLIEQGLDDRLEVMTSEYDTDTFFPGNRFRVVRDVQGKTKEIDEQLDNGLLTEEQSRRIVELRQEYVMNSRDIEDDLDQNAQLSFDVFGPLLELTMLEEPFEQGERRGNVVLYAIDENEELLYRTVVDLDNTEVTSQSMCPLRSSYAHESLTDQMLRYDAENENANVYIMTNPSRKVTAKLMIEYAVDHLQKMHDMDSMDIFDADDDELDAEDEEGC